MYWLAIILFIVCVEHGVKRKDISFLASVNEKVLEERVKGTSTMWQKAKQCCSALSWRQHYSHGLPVAFCLSFFSGAMIKSSDLRKHKAGRLYFNLEFQATGLHFKKVTNVRAWDSWFHHITVKNREKRDYLLKWNICPLLCPMPDCNLSSSRPPRLLQSSMRMLHSFQQIATSLGRTFKLTFKFQVKASMTWSLPLCPLTLCPLL